MYLSRLTRSEASKFTMAICVLESRRISSYSAQDESHRTRGINNAAPVPNWRLRKLSGNSVNSQCWKPKEAGDLETNAQKSWQQRTHPVNRLEFFIIGTFPSSFSLLVHPGYKVIDGDIHHQGGSSTLSLLALMSIIHRHAQHWG